MRISYNPSIVALSFGVAFLGSYMAISICEQYRQIRIGLVVSRLWYDAKYCLIVMAICLGGVGIWCMHFIGMFSITMYDDNGDEIQVRYNIGMTLLSLVIVLICSALGFYVSSHDDVFMKTRKDVLKIFVEDSKQMTMQDALHITPLQMIWMIGIHNPVYLVCGGICTGSGVVLMHYIGMGAMSFNGRIVWDAGIISASCIIAFLASTAAFWILFRFLSVYANREVLRLLCALTMAVAVCGMHYTGMAAASFRMDPSVHVSVGRTMSSTEAFTSGIAVAITVSFVAAVIALSELRYSVWRLTLELGRADETVINLPTSNPAHCASQVRRYIHKRKHSAFSLGVINNTYVLEYDDDDDSSVQSARTSLRKPASQDLSSPRMTFRGGQVVPVTTATSTMQEIKEGIALAGCTINSDDHHNHSHGDDSESGQQNKNKLTITANKYSTNTLHDGNDNEDVFSDASSVVSAFKRTLTGVHDAKEREGGGTAGTVSTKSDNNDDQQQQQHKLQQNLPHPMDEIV